MKFKIPPFLDPFLLSLFVVIITFQPFFLYGEANLFEWGIYLPGIQAILNGQIPYRDFFYLRGPFELYVPTFLMLIFGKKISVLAAFFYIGTIISLILCVWIGRKIYRTRLILYLMVVVLVARTFPRVVFTFWGGMRFALGLTVVLLLIQFLQTKDKKWLLFSGIVTSLALLTSVDIGVASFISTFVSMGVVFIGNNRALESTKKIKSEEAFNIIKFAEIYFLGLLIIIVPYLLYLIATKSFIPFIDANLVVMTKMEKVFNVYLGTNVPRNLIQALIAMFIPWSDSFKHMTPAYLYVFLGIYLFSYRRKVFISQENLAIIPIATYGLLMYIFAFRNIQASQFEMALQPEKILLFFLLEEGYLYLKNIKAKIVQPTYSRADVIVPGKKHFWQKTYFVNFLIIALIGSSVGYAISRFSKRFFTFQYVCKKITGRDVRQLQPLSEEPYLRFNDGPLEGLYVPMWQGQDFLQTMAFFETNSTKNDRILVLNELGIYHFILDRPNVSRFPMYIFSWMDDFWYQEFMKDFKKRPPKYILINQQLPPWFEENYFQFGKNKKKYVEILAYLKKYYKEVKRTPSLIIYGLK